MWTLALLVLSPLLLNASAALAFDCNNPKLPSSIVICSDQELLRLADERQRAFNEARWGITGTDLLDPEQDKELWENQRAWVRGYASECGVPSGQPAPRVPIPLSIISCFRNAAEARITYLHAYGERVRASRRPAHGFSASAKIGPGFDCAGAARPLPSMICADAELSRTDLRFNQAYWALHGQLDGRGRRQLADEDLRFLDRVTNRCGIPHAGALTPDIWRGRECVRDAYETQRLNWIDRLHGAAREEATRPIESHIALERKLRRLGFLRTPPIPEGIYDNAVRRAVIEWQAARGRPATGILGDLDAATLRQEGEPTTSNPLVALSPPLTPKPTPLPAHTYDPSLRREAALKSWMDCLFEAADALADQPESARTIAEAAYGSCGKLEVAFKEVSMDAITSAGVDRIKTDALTPKLLARIMATRAAVSKLNKERGTSRGARPSPAIEYNQ
jgi:uncharacterized protein/peptidoglycan hydrolase-like protein with peptidoglycan-binding domain